MRPKFHKQLLEIWNHLFGCTIGLAFVLSAEGLWDEVVSSPPTDVFWRRLLLGSIALYFVIEDWIVSRQVISRLHIPGKDKDDHDGGDHLAFALMDVVLILLSAPFLWAAFHAHRTTGIFFALILLFGAVWALFALIRGYADHNIPVKKYLQRMATVQLLCFVVVSVVYVSRYDIFLGRAFANYSDYGLWASLGVGAVPVANRIAAPLFLWLISRIRNNN